MSKGALGASVLAGCCWALGSAAALAAAQIEWEVVNRFPLVRHADDWHALMRTADEYRASPKGRNPATRVPETWWDPYRQVYGRDLIEVPMIVRLSARPHPEGATCTWTVGEKPLGDRSCSDARIVLPWDKPSADVTVRVEHSGRQDDPVSRTITVRSLLIVSLGDSYASGEGVPDVDIGDPFISGLVDRSDIPLPYPALWWDQRCHRSLYSGPAQAAMALAKKNPHVQVVFASFACSGAEIYQGILAPYVGRQTYPQLAAQLRTYLPNAPGTVPNRKGGCMEAVPQPAGPPKDQLVSAETLSCLGRGDAKEEFDIDECTALCAAARTGLQHNGAKFVGPLPSQLNALIWLVCAKYGDGPSVDAPPFSLTIRRCESFHRPIDALLISIGGNDIGFGDLVRYSIQHGNAFDLAGFRRQREAEQSRLSERYAELARAITEHVANVQKPKPAVLITSYPDPTFAAPRPGREDHRCGVRLDVMWGRQRSVSSHMLDLFFYGISENEVGDVRRLVIGPLCTAIGNAAEKSGWTLVDAHVDAFRNHGYCNKWGAADTAPWLNTHDDALMRQGQLAKSYDSGSAFSTGVLHPNILGQTAYAEAIERELGMRLLRNEASGKPRAKCEG
jgi:hypothetical protein